MVNLVLQSSMKKMITISKWDCRYLELARLVSTWSKDPSTKCGAVIIGDFGQILSTGYNGFPRGIEDTDERLNDRPTKYQLTVHAEMNAIHNASLVGIRLYGSTLYVYGLPMCSDCTKGVIQSGIKHVVMQHKSEIHEPWISHYKLTAQLLNEADVTHKVVYFDE